MTNGTTPTPESNARNIADLTQAVDILVSQFIRPNAQQANANRESINEVVDLLNRHARALVEIDERLEGVVRQQEANTHQITANSEQIAAIGDRLEQFDTRLEETRQLVAKNASDIAKLTVKQTRNAQQIEANAQQVEALAEASRTQLAGIIGNGRRIDRLEQQAS